MPHASTETPGIAPTPVTEPLASPTRGQRAVRRTIAALGIVNVVVMAGYVAASYGFARLAPFGTPEPIEARAFDRLADAVAPAGSAVHAFLRGDTALADPSAFFNVYASFLLVPSIVFVALLAVLSRRREALNDPLARSLFRWAAAFAVVLAFAHPVLVQDFWLSAGWGRLIARGVNPYYVNLDPQVTAGLPLDYLGLLMTYGPLWALVAGAVMAVAGAGPFVAGLLFKASLACAWIGALALVAHLLRTRPAADRCVGMAIAGWLPLGAFQIVAEGHNDVGMVLLLLLWLALLERGRHLAGTVSLAASVLVKYLSAPLFLLDLLHTIRSRGKRWTAYLPYAAAAALLGLVVFGIFFRSPAFFASTAHMADWHFFTPRDGVVTTGRLLGIEPSLGSLGGMLVAALAIGVQGFFLLLLAYGVWRYWRTPAPESFRYAVLTMTAGILFGVVGHIWPWFLAWGLVIAALHPASAITRWTTGVALAVPFPLVHWTAFPGPDQLVIVTPAMYLFAVAWFLLAPRRWFGTDKAAAHCS
ncbi:MAG: hypothetical protein ACRELX_07735 [Longimicrobiales bacterium]